MQLIDITPFMTSNTTPSPYVASCSSHYGIADAYVAFCGGCWHSYDGANRYPQWLKFDFGKNQKVDAYGIAMNTGTLAASMPKSFELQGSYDDVTYIKMDERPTESGWDLGEQRVYKLRNPVDYRYYKLVVKSDNGYKYAIFGMKFFELQYIYNVSHKRAFYAQTLPMSNTQKILAKTDDTREGLLGMANDVQNYGDLYVVGRDGKSHLTKAGIKMETIFEGKTAALADYDLVHSINKYKEIRIHATGYSEDKGFVVETIYPNTVNNDPRQFSLYFLGTREIAFGFTSDTILHVDEILMENAPYVGITKIMGIY